MATDYERYIFAVTHPTERVPVTTVKINAIVREIAQKAAQEAARAVLKGDI